MDGSRFTEGQVYRCNAQNWGPCSITIVRRLNPGECTDYGEEYLQYPTAVIRFSGTFGSCPIIDILQSKKMIIFPEGDAGETMYILLEGVGGQLMTTVCNPANRHFIPHNNEDGLARFNSEIDWVPGEGGGGGGVGGGGGGVVMQAPPMSRGALSDGRRGTKRPKEEDTLLSFDTREMLKKNDMIKEVRRVDPRVLELVAQTLEEIDPCSICLEPLIAFGKDRNLKVVTLNCLHMFHESCLENYKKAEPNATCPLCRKISLGPRAIKHVSTQFKSLDLKF